MKVRKIAALYWKRRQRAGRRTNMSRVVKFVYENGEEITVERESEDLIREISQLTLKWSVAVHARDVDALLEYSPRWCEISEKLCDFWGQLGGPKLPATSEEHEKDKSKDMHPYRVL